MLGGVFENGDQVLVSLGIGFSSEVVKAQVSFPMYYMGEVRFYDVIIDGERRVVPADKVREVVS